MAGLTDIFRRNIKVISHRYPGLAHRLSEADPDLRFRAVPAKTGAFVPVYTYGTEAIHLNSPYDPEKEAERTVIGATGLKNRSNSYLLFGLDAGYAPAKLLEQDIELILVVEIDIPYLRFLIGAFDLSNQLNDPRLRLIFGDSPARVETALLNEYLPLLHGDISILPRSPRERIRESFFSNLRNRLPQILGNTSVDISTQKKFGLRWMRNIVANMSFASAEAKNNYPAMRGFKGKRIHITAAGPSLEESLPGLSSLSGDECIIATDTSLPALIAAGIEPDFVVSVDCQSHSYHHFISGVPAACHLVLDLSSPPLFYRLGNPVIPVAGGHPFAGYLCQYFFQFIGIDTSGGNVTHAAVSFADRLAGKAIALHGADFSYPDGKLYAKGTYLYPHFRSAEKRTSSLETMFARMLLERNDLDLSWSSGGSACYHTALLDSYKERLTASLEKIDTPLTISNQDIERKPISWELFGSELLRDLENLEIGSLPVNVLLDNLGVREKRLLVSLMPLSARAYGEDKRGWEMLEYARREAFWIVKDKLSSKKDNPAIADE